MVLTVGEAGEDQQREQPAGQPATTLHMGHHATTLGMTLFTGDW
jgi:hypothetical protein